MYYELGHFDTMLIIYGKSEYYNYSHFPFQTKIRTYIVLTFEFYIDFTYGGHKSVNPAGMLILLVNKIIIIIYSLVDYFFSRHYILSSTSYFFLFTKGV